MATAYPFHRLPDVTTNASAPRRPICAAPGMIRVMGEGDDEVLVEDVVDEIVAGA